MGLVRVLTETPLGVAIKTIGRLGAVIYSVFFGGMPVAVQLAVWPRIVIAIAILCSLPLLRAMRSKANRGKLTWLALAFVVVGIVFGGWYWLTFPSMTINVREGDYVVATRTSETAKELERLGLRDTPSDLIKLIAGQQNKTVESFFVADELRSNKRWLAIQYILFLALTTVGIMMLLEWIPQKKKPKEDAGEARSPDAPK